MVYENVEEALLNKLNNIPVILIFSLSSLYFIVKSTDRKSTDRKITRSLQVLIL